MGAIDLSIDQLLLDSSNPRIANPDSQRDALQALLDDQEEKLFALAEDIVDKGLSPIERLLVLRERPGSNRFIALEGNRRVAALKILVNPHVLTSLTLKASLQRRFEALAQGFDRGMVEPLACFEVADRDEGNEWIYLRHTGENEGRGVVNWTGVAAARFRGREPALQALEFVKNYGNLTDEEKTLAGNKFRISTLDRLLSSPEVRALIGLDVFDQKLRSGLPPDELIKPLKRIVLDVARKEITSRKLNDKSAQIEYVKNLRSSDKPDLSRIGPMRAVDEIRGDEFKAAPPSHASKKRRRPDPSERKTVVPPRLKLDIQDNKVADIFKELRTLRVEDSRNAVAVLLRVFLELSIDCYMDGKGMPLRYRSKQNKLVEKTLKEKLREVVAHLVDVEGADKKDFASVMRALDVEHSPLNIDLLHRYLHNRFETPKTRDLMAAWNDAQRLFERIWA